MGYALTTYQKESELPVIGFDMGGMMVVLITSLLYSVSLLSIFPLVYVLLVTGRSET